MQPHRELYRSLVPDDAYIISFSNLLSCVTPTAAKRIAKEIYYNIGGNIETAAMKRGTAAHAIKEAEISDDWVNELRLAYKMFDGYYLTGTLDRYYNKLRMIEDFKTTTSNPSAYLKTMQIETYSFLAMNNDLMVEHGCYTTINERGETLLSAPVKINAATAVNCYGSFILPRFNMIKNEIERLKNQYV